MNELFFGINIENKEELMQTLEVNTLHFKKNMTILSSISNYIGIIKSGCVHIIKTDYNGNITIIDELLTDNIFGSHINYLSNNEYSIITKEDTDIMLFDIENIITYKNNNEYFNQFLKNLINVLNNKIISSNQRIDLLTNKSIRNRLLAYFKIMSKRNNSNIINIPFNYSDLAEYLAVNRSAMSREMSNLKDEGLIEVKGKKIKLLYYIK